MTSEKAASRGLSEEEINKKRELREREVSELLDGLEQERKEQRERATQQLEQSLSELAVPQIEVLLRLGAASLLPGNQAKEMRFVQIAELALSKKSVEPTGKEKNLLKLFSDFDDTYGPSHVTMERDNLDIVYISWVKHGESYYRTFSGTLAESELFFKESLRKTLALAPALPEPYSHLRQFLTWAFARINDFIEEAGLVEHENEMPADAEKDKIVTTGEADKLHGLLEGHFVIWKDSLEQPVRATLGSLSKKPADYSPEFQAQYSDVYQYPVVDLGDKFIIPFPQFLISASFFQIYAIAMHGKQKDAIATAFLAHSKEAVGSRLRKTFGSGKVIEDLAIEGTDWMDFCVKFDGKLICVKLASSIADGEPNKMLDVDAVGQKVVEGFEGLKKNPSKQVTAKDKPYRFDLLVGKLEPVFIVIIDHASLDLGFGSNWSTDGYLTEILPFSHFDYLLRKIANPLHFLRFLRSIKRLRDKDVQFVGSDHIDLYALYDSDGLQLRDSVDAPNVLLVDSTSGTRFINKNIQEYRKERILAVIDGKRVALRKHWDHFYGTFQAGRTLKLYRFDSQPTITIEAYAPTSAREHSSSAYLVFDSLCYFLDQSLDDLKLYLGDAKELSIKFNFDEQAKTVVAKRENNGGKIHVEFTIPPDAYQLFADGTNRGERTALEAFLKALEVEDMTKVVDKLKPLSAERNFQSKGYYLAHKSYENDVRPLVITPGDRMWVDEVISGAVLNAGVKPGTYSKPGEVGRLATVVKNAAMEELHKRLVLYPKRALIEDAYAQLEMDYVTNEKRQYELLANLDTNRDKDIIDEHITKDQDLTQLSFANRFLLEFAIQTRGEGEELLTDETYTELLALAERVVAVDFWGDSTYLGLQPGKMHITEAGFPSIETTGGEAGKLNKLRMKLQLGSLERRLEKIQEETAAVEEESGGIEDVLAKLAEAHKETFGFTLEERSKVERELLSIFNESDESPIVMTTRRILIDRTVSRSGLPEETVTKVIENLTLSQSVLAGKDISPSERYWREERILNKPLVAFPGNEHVLLFSRFVLEKSVLLYYDRLLTGRLEYLQNHRDGTLYRVVMDMVNESAHEFEEHIAEKVRETELQIASRVTSLAGTPIAQEVGEIDGIVWDKKHQRIVVTEDKNNVPSRSPVEIKSEMDNYFGRDGEPGYYDKLSRKLKWVQENEAAVRKHFSIADDVVYTTEGVMVTKSIVAAAVLKKPPFKTMRQDEFLDYLSKTVS